MSSMRGEESASRAPARERTVYDSAQTGRRAITEAGDIGKRAFVPRSAFVAAAIGVDPDVVRVDETLAVGDERFRKKCHERMAALRGGGRTFLFVSHGLEEVVKHCDRTLWLHRGRVLMDGPSSQVVEGYKRWSQTGELPGSEEPAPATFPRDEARP